MKTTTTKAELFAEELLILMTCAFDLLAMPTFRKWDQSYEGWLYQNGLLGRLQHLEKQKLLVREGKRSEWVFHVTKAGRQFGLGGRDPEERWQRKWDGWWRQFVFDLPTPHHSRRSTLIRWLRCNGFGYLQDSVWISPDPVPDLGEKLKGLREDAEAFIVLECRCAPGFTNASLVRGAWLFDTIRDRYLAYQRFAAEAGRTLRKERLHPRDLFALLRTEKEHWWRAFRLDPLLPLSLWPKDYEGRRAWQTRQDLLRSAASQVEGK